MYKYAHTNKAANILFHNETCICTHTRIGSCAHTIPTTHTWSRRTPKKKLYWFEKEFLRLVLMAGREKLWWRLKERKFKICAAEKLLVVKIQFEELCFKTSFEGRREWLWWTARGTEFQICVQQRSRRHNHHAVLFCRLGFTKFYHLRKNAVTYKGCRSGHGQPSTKG